MFGTELKAARVKKRLSTKKFAESIDITRQYLSDIETNKHLPSFKLVVKMDKLLPGLMDIYLKEVGKTI